MINRIVIASGNDGKIQELSQIIHSVTDLKMKVKSLRDYFIAEPDEPYDDFMLNAVHKAKYYAKHTEEACLSDDSGLCIEALNGFPGVRSKGFIAECGSNINAFIKLEQMLSLSNNRSAFFTCAMALYVPTQDLLITHEEKEYGSVNFPARGDLGFAYDPIFIPKGFDQTFAELGIEQKNKMSHRAKAMRGIIEKLLGNRG